MKDTLIVCKRHGLGSLRAVSLGIQSQFKFGSWTLLTLLELKRESCFYTLLERADPPLRNTLSLRHLTQTLNLRKLLTGTLESVAVKVTVDFGLI